jgi:hypothetical protein
MKSSHPTLDLAQLKPPDEYTFRSYISNNLISLVKHTKKNRMKKKANSLNRWKDDPKNVRNEKNLLLTYGSLSFTNLNLLFTLKFGISKFKTLKMR